MWILHPWIPLELHVIWIWHYVNEYSESQLEIGYLFLSPHYEYFVHFKARPWVGCRSRCTVYVFVAWMAPCSPPTPRVACVIHTVNQVSESYSAWSILQQTSAKKEDFRDFISFLNFLRASKNIELHIFISLTKSAVSRRLKVDSYRLQQIL